MTPITEAVEELRLVVERTERRSILLRCAPRDTLEDHRTEALADVLEALDRVDPPLGTRLLAALYPRGEHLHATPIDDLFASVPA